MRDLTFYLAARYSRREELCRYKADLEARGHHVPARWLLGEHQVHGVEAARKVEDRSGPVPAAEAELFAADDVADLLAADVLINFTEIPRTVSDSRGGRHVEFGLALGTRIVTGGPMIVIVGPLENVFHAVPQVDVTFDTWGDFLMALDKTPVIPSSWTESISSG